MQMVQVNIPLESITLQIRETNSFLNKCNFRIVYAIGKMNIIITFVGSYHIEDYLIFHVTYVLIHFILFFFSLISTNSHMHLHSDDNLSTKILCNI